MGFVIWDSLTGRKVGSPYTADVDAKINFFTLVSLHASIIDIDALKFNSTFLRIGSKIFGPRS